MAEQIKVTKETLGCDWDEHCQARVTHRILTDKMGSYFVCAKHSKEAEKNSHVVKIEEFAYDK